ncbi:ferric reductase like transmembrane component-domain-containing protein [Bisporella sp. PMI_857]|nr:ferric reductase like transmembrane component-domain-containing protein [Bisporella sp. PMI_857]
MTKGLASILIRGLLIIAATLRIFKPQARGKGASDSEARNQKQRSAYSIGWLLPESFAGFFGHVTWLQVVVLCILLAYLLIFSLVGIVYETWVTPARGYTSLYNRRTGICGFSDRVEAIAYALTPLTVAPSTRESILSLITGIPYQSFNFLHRWCGRIIFIQSVIHTAGWYLIEARYYQPQPTAWKKFIAQLYVIWGVIALIFITFLYVFSSRSVLRLTGYESFRKAHYVVAMLYIGACRGHWNQLACWIIASLGIWGLGRGIRLLRNLLIHVGHADGSTGRGFHPAQPSLKYFDDKDGGVVRLDFEHKQNPWAVGQHFFLCFPALTIWQSHPLTTASLPTSNSDIVHHTYISLALNQAAKLFPKEGTAATPNTTPVILTGPYGVPLISNSSNIEPTNIPTTAGGTGVSLTLPIVLADILSPAVGGTVIEFIWTNLNIQIIVTQGAGASASTSSLPRITNKNENNASEIDADMKTYLLSPICSSLIDISHTNRTRVIASGPAGMGHDLRSAVAQCNYASRVLKGERTWDVDL